MPATDQLLAEAEELLDQGRLQDACVAFEELCVQAPGVSEYRRVLGAVYAEVGDFSKAEECIRLAIELDPGDADSYFTFAQLLIHLSRHTEAIELVLKSVELEPEWSDAWINLSGLYGQTGRLQEAMQSAQKAIELGTDNPQAYTNLAHALQQLGRDEEAKKVMEQMTALGSQDAGSLLELANTCLRTDDLKGAASGYYNILNGVDPGMKEAQYGLGLVHKLREQHQDAIRCFQLALVSNPGYSEARLQLADTLAAQGETKRAESHYLLELRHNPHNADLMNSLGNLFIKTGDFDKASQWYDKALGTDPGHVAALINQGDIKAISEEFDGALDHYRFAIKQAPGEIKAREKYADLLEQEGRFDQALGQYEEILNIEQLDRVKVKLALATPVIIESRRSIKQTRDRLQRGIDSLMHADIRVENPASDICKTLFYPVYHGLNDLELQTGLARFYEMASPGLLYTAPHCLDSGLRPGTGKIRIGLISRFFCTHTMGTIMKGVVEHLPRENLEVILFTFPYRQDPNAQAINQVADRVIELPPDWRQAHEIVGQRQLDVLFYTDVGMDPYTYFLAYARLAPVQCTTWGHPVTTGLKNMDYYISYSGFEPEGAAEHYSEQLVLLDAPLTFYEKPKLSDSGKKREDFDWSPDANLYLCPQTLYKLHPDFDIILAGILREDPDAQIVLVDCRHQNWADLLMKRLRAGMGDLADRILVLKYPGAENYLNLLKLCDVMLDSYHYGGGSTSLQGLALGTPIVTLPGNFQRGRHTYGYYKKMNYMECVATSVGEYIDIAVRLGRDKNYRDKVSRQILDSNDVLYKNQEVVNELAIFFITSTEHCRRTALPG